MNLSTTDTPKINYRQYLQKNIRFFEFALFAAGLDYDDTYIDDDPLSERIHIIPKSHVPKTKFSLFQRYFEVFREWYPIARFFGSTWYHGEKQPVFVWLERILREGYPYWHELPDCLISEAEKSFRYKCSIDDSFSKRYPLMARTILGNITADIKDSPSTTLAEDKTSEDNNIADPEAELTPELYRNRLLKEIKSETLKMIQYNSPGISIASKRKSLRNTIVKLAIENIYQIDEFKESEYMGLAKQLKNFIFTIIKYDSVTSSNADLKSAIDISDDTFKDSIKESGLKFHLDYNPDDILWEKIYTKFGLSYNSGKKY